MESIAVSGSQVFLSSPNNLFSVSKPSYFPLTSLPTKPPKFVPLKASSTLTCDDQEINRTFKKLQPSPWTDQFHSVSIGVSEMDALRKEIDVLKPKVKKTLMYNQGVNTTKKRILMIYLLRSLGLEYHFKEEIDETLKEGFEKIEEMMAGEEDLYTVSIIFSVFRSYGHNISSDVFRRFKGIDGNFKESLKGDAKGILSLYEAGHLRKTKDYILDEALSFTSSHLESLDSCGTCPTHLAIRIRNALTLPQHCNMEIVATVEYIASYEQEKDHDKMLLKFAKISLKLVQLQYLHDLKIVSKWYKEQEFASKFPPFFRDKLVENYFYGLGVFFEPQQSRARIVCTQCFTLFGIIDDTFDRYASLSEAESLANSLERWAPDRDMDKQPGYLKLVLNFIFDTFEEFERVLRPEDVKATIEEFKTYAKAQRRFAKWVHTAHVPSFAEYMEVGVVEDAAYAGIACYFMCLGNLVTKEAYEWLKSRPKLVQSITTKLRLLNDIYGFEDDMDRGCVQNAVYCYMKQYGVTKEEAVTELHKMAIDADKEINEEFLTTRGVSRLVLNVAMNFSKMLTLCYNGYEGYTNPEKKIEEYMTSILVDLIRL